VRLATNPFEQWLDCGRVTRQVLEKKIQALDGILEV